MNLIEAKEILNENGYLINETLNAQTWIDAVLKIDPELETQIENDLYKYFDCYTDNAGLVYQRDVGRDSMADSVYDYLDSITYDELVSEFGTPEEYANDYCN